MKNCFLFALLALCPAANAQDVIEIERDDPVEVETLINGDVTAIRPAALLLATFDTSGDYVIDVAELTTGQEAAFAKADTDGSQHLSIIEIETWRKAALGSSDAVPGRMAFDPNLDNRVTRAEFGSVLLDLFRESDVNEDKKLEFTELVNVFDMPKRREIRERPAFTNDPLNQTRRRPRY